LAAQWASRFALVHFQAGGSYADPHERPREERTPVATGFRACPMKRCTKCGATKPLNDFPANKLTRDGKGSWCKACISANTAAYLKTDRGKQTQKKQQAAGYYRFGKGAIPILRQNALARGLTFELTADTFERWWHETPDRCVYCGITIQEFIRLRDFIVTYAGTNYEISKFKRVFKSPKHAAINWLTLDRMDNARGYEMDNLVKSCWFCNSIKGSILSHADMLMIAAGIIQRLQAHVEAAK